MTIKTNIMIIVTCLIILIPSFCLASETSENSSSKPLLIKTIHQNFTPQINKTGRVSLIRVNPLALKSSSHQNQKPAYSVGVSILAQDDVIFSTGLGAVFKF